MIAKGAHVYDFKKCKIRFLFLAPDSMIKNSVWALNSPTDARIHLRHNTELKQEKKSFISAVILTITQLNDPTFWANKL